MQTASRKSAVWGCHSHAKAHSAPAMPPRRDRKAHSGRATSRKGAFCVRASPKGALCMRAVVASRDHFCRSVYTPAYPRLPATAQQCTQVPQNGTERPSSPVCVHSCRPTAARAAGRGPQVPRRRRPHGPRDARVPGPEVHATGAVTQPPTHTSSRSLIYYPRNNVGVSHTLP